MMSTIVKKMLNMLRSGITRVCCHLQRVLICQNTRLADFIKPVISSLLLTVAIQGQVLAQLEGPVSVIFDTDVGTDYDDVAALAILHTLADEGHVEILATTLSYKMSTNAQFIQCLNAHYGRPHLPIGEVKINGLGREGSRKWMDVLLDSEPAKYSSAIEIPDAIEVLRKALVSQPDSSVTIITVGFFTNLANLLDSNIDSVSNLTGHELVKRKVRRLVSMAGRFPEGREFNIYAERNSAKKVIENWPTEIIFSGAEIGRYIRTGDKLVASAPARHPVKMVYEVAMQDDMQDFDNSWYEMGGRASYAQTVVLAGLFGIEGYFNQEKGIMTVLDDGSNIWEIDQNGRHVRLVMAHSFQEMADVIEELMMRSPRHSDNDI